MLTHDLEVNHRRGHSEFPHLEKTVFAQKTSSTMVQFCGLIGAPVETALKDCPNHLSQIVRIANPANSDKSLVSTLAPYWAGSLIYHRQIWSTRCEHIYPDFPNKIPDMGKMVAFQLRQPYLNAILTYNNDLAKSILRSVI